MYVSIFYSKEKASVITRKMLKIYRIIELKISLYLTFYINVNP